MALKSKIRFPFDFCPLLQQLLSNFAVVAPGDLSDPPSKPPIATGHTLAINGRAKLEIVSKKTPDYCYPGWARVWLEAVYFITLRSGFINVWSGAAVNLL